MHALGASSGSMHWAGLLPAARFQAAAPTCRCTPTPKSVESAWLELMRNLGYSLRQDLQVQWTRWGGTPPSPWVLGS